MKRQIIRKTFTIMICLMSFSFTLNHPLAKEKTGSISLDSHYINNGEVIELTDITFQIIKVANIVDGEYINTNTFTEFKNIPTTMNGSQISEISNELQDYMKNHEISFMYEKKTNSNGKVQFKNLEIGLYLIAQKQENQPYIFNSFLISLPMFENGNELYDIYAKPKFEKKEDVVNDQSITNKTEDLVSTGDQSNQMLWILLAMTSLLMIVLIFLYENKGSKRS